MSSKTVEQLIVENNELREELNAENEAYYGKILLYMRITAIFRNEVEIETTLLSLLQDLLVAQSNGENATDYFGKNAQEMCQVLTKQTSRSTAKNILKFSLIGFASYALASVFFGLAKPTMTLNIGQLVVGFLMAILGIGCFLSVFKFFIFKQPTTPLLKNKLLRILGYLLGGILFSVVILAPIFLVKEMWIVTIPYPYDVIVVGVLLIICLVAAICYKVSWLTDLMPFIFLMSCLSFLSRTPIGKEVIAKFSESDTKMIIGILILAGLGYLTLFIPVFKVKKRNENHD